MSNEDENGSMGKEKNPMVQRILLEVQRREPNSVRLSSVNFAQENLFVLDQRIGLG